MKPANISNHLTAEDVRSLCYRAAAGVRLACLSLKAVEAYDTGETLIAVDWQLQQWEEALNDVAGGATFDRLSRIEQSQVSEASETD